MRTAALALLALLALLGAGCSDKKPSTTSTTSAPAAALPLPAPTAPTSAPVIPPQTRQLVTALVESWTSTRATLQRWERTDGGAWTAVGASWPGVIGKAGAAWGAGLHGKGAPDREGPTKREGDGKSPAGVFEIGSAFGYADEPPKGTRLDYTSSGTGDLECIDDPASEHYAKIVERKQVPSDWESSEQLLRDDALYTWVVDILHNPDRKPSAGSCIFLHVWGGPESSTVGCTAMEEPRLVDLIKALDPAAKPVFVLLPRADYAALATAWGLPAQ